MTSDAALPCPRCVEPRTVTLVPVALERITIDACPACRGAWLDDEEWAPLVGRSRAVRHPRTIPFGVEPPLCPKCPEQREAFGRGRRRPQLVPRSIAEVPDVEVDICQECGGAWLDAGELATLRDRLAATDGAGEPAAAPGPRAAASTSVTPPWIVSTLRRLLSKA